MHDTLSSLVERAVLGNVRPLEFYLREHSRLPGPRANLELANDVSNLLAASIPKNPDSVYTLINHFTNGDRQTIASNTPDEFVMLCGIIAFGTCAAVQPSWREATFELLKHYALNSYWRVREGVALAYQHLLATIPEETIAHLLELSKHGSYLQCRAVIAAVAEPQLMYKPELLDAALQLHQPVLASVHAASSFDRKSEDFKALRRTLGYSLSIIAAADSERGFALMRECAAWNDTDISWILRENLKKKRLAKFSEQVHGLEALLS